MQRHWQSILILDTDDQKKLINVMKGDLDPKFSPQLILYHIDQWKNKDNCRIMPIRRN